MLREAYSWMRRGCDGCIDPEASPPHLPFAVLKLPL
jgi:hypothetical protein